MLLFPIGFFYACFMVASKRIAAKQRKENAVFLGTESGWRTNASFDFIEPSARPQFHRNVYNCALYSKGFLDVAAFVNIMHHLCKRQHDFRLTERDLQQFHHLIIGQFSRTDQKAFQHSGTSAKTMNRIKISVNFDLPCVDMPSDNQNQVCIFFISSVPF